MICCCGAVYRPNTPEALAAKWEELLSQPERLVEMSRQEHQAFSEKFHIDKLTNQMVAVYQSLKFS